ncbi:MAG: EamA family transporter [Bacillota bacterium]
MLYNYAIGKVGAGTSSVFINLEPFFALVGAAIFLGERILLVQIIGFVLIVLGILLGDGTLNALFQTKVFATKKGKSL